MRLIDADPLIAELEKDEEMFDREAEDGKQNPQNCTAGYAEAMWSRANGIRDAIISIYDAPTINAVKADLHTDGTLWIDIDNLKGVVGIKNVVLSCSRWCATFVHEDDNWYCSNGERK